MNEASSTGTGAKVWNRDEVEFRQWVRNTEKVLKEIEEFDGGCEGELRLRRQVLRTVDGQCHARLGRVLDAVVVAHDQGYQVRAHGHRFVKVVLHLLTSTTTTTTTT